MPQNRPWKTVYIRLADWGNLDKNGNTKYKWVAIGRMYGHGTLNERVVLD